MAGSSKTINYLSEAEIIAINEKMVSRFGGLHGVKDTNMLRLAIGRPQMSAGFQDAYKSIFDKAAAIPHSVINNHPFLDGNKRTSLFSAILFLEYNGWEVIFTKKEAVKFTMKAHSDDWSVEQISDWLETHSLKKRK